MTLASSLRTLQERVRAEIPERFHYARILAVLALQEEVGELLEEFSKAQTDKAVTPAINSELGDVLLSCIEIANTFGLQLTMREAGAVDSGRNALALQVCIAAARVSKECLEIEGFERSRQNELLEALNDLLGQVASLALYLEIDLEVAFENKFRKILTRIEDGTWDRLYGNLLLEKREKFD
jgi:NTP pyrophosphatase (non-canonical NTP hydrolase)